MGGRSEEYMAEADGSLVSVYRRFPVVLDHGEGVRLYDTEGREYLDAASGIGVMAAGYGDREYLDAMKSQLEALPHTSNLYYSPVLGQAAEAVCQISGMDRVFFTNSGAEAIEGAIKTARKYAFLKGRGKKIIAMNHSFHGRTIGALSVTGSGHYREPFYPLMEGVVYADFNDLASVEALMDETVCAVILETVQGEGGVMPARSGFLHGIRRLCDDYGALLILDEIQCGMGRTGYPLACQAYHVKPDIVTMAKALGLGFPVGAFAVTEEVAARSLVPGDHGSTYGGNPMACVAVKTSIDLMLKRRLPYHVQVWTPYFRNILADLVDRYSFVTGFRGMGFMEGLVLDIPVGEAVQCALGHGLLILPAGENVLRLLPPLVYEKKDFDELKEKLIAVFDEMEAAYRAGKKEKSQHTDE